MYFHLLDSHLEIQRIRNKKLTENNGFTLYTNNELSLHGCITAFWMQCCQMLDPRFYLIPCINAHKPFTWNSCIHMPIFNCLWKQILIYYGLVFLTAKVTSVQEQKLPKALKSRSNFIFSFSLGGARNTCMQQFFINACNKYANFSLIWIGWQIYWLTGDILRNLSRAFIPARFQNFELYPRKTLNPIRTGLFEHI